MKQLIYFLVSIVCLNSCTSRPQKNDIIDQLPQEDYIIPDTLYSFFPKHSNNKSKPVTFVTNAGDTNLPYSSEEFAVTFIVKIFEFPDTSYLIPIKCDLSDYSIHKFISEERNYFVIDSERGMLSKYDTLDLKEKYLSYQDIPLILSFHRLLNENTVFYNSSSTCGLSDGYEILVLKSGKKYVLPEKYQNEWDILPNKLKHGYTSGVAFKETEPFIIYWVVAW